jgi:type II secretory pathway pseudopilin PulG
MKTKAFTLLEIVIILAMLAIIAGSMVPLLIKSVETDREKITLERMRAINEAIMGNQRLGSFGYIGDVGDMPPSLNDLITKPGGVSAFAFYTNNVGYGWRGPYLDVEFQSLKDGWGNDFKFSTADGLPEGQIKSSGPDGSLGNSDDIVFPFLPNGEKVEKNAPLLVTVMVDSLTVTPASVRGGGLPNPRDTVVEVFYASNGAEVVTPLSQSAKPLGFDNVGFLFNIHHGPHAVRITFGPEGSTNTNLFTVWITGGVQNHAVFRHTTTLSTITP